MRPRLILILLLALVGVPPAYATTVGAKVVKCPVCATEVKGMEVRSTNNMGGVDRDLLQRAAGSQPLLIVATTCPKCHYSAWLGGFEKPVADEVKKAILAGGLKVPDHDGQGELPGWVRHDLIAQVLLLKKASDDDVGSQYLNTSWAVRLESRPFGKLMPDDQTSERLIKATTLVDDKSRDQNRARLELKVGSALLAGMAAAPAQDRYAMAVLAGMLLRAHGEHDALLAALPAILAAAPESERAELEKRVRASIELERLYQRRAVEHLTRRLEQDPKYERPEDKAVLTYLCAELNRRLGQRAEALRLFDLAAAAKPLPEGLENWIQEQRALVAPEGK